LGQKSAVDFYHAQLAAISKELISKFIYLGHCRTYFGDTFSSTEAYQSALKLDENNADVLTFIGRNYLQRADYLKAKLYFEKARSINPFDPMMLYYHAKCCQGLGQMRDAETSLLSILHSNTSVFETTEENGQSHGERWLKFTSFSIGGLRGVKLWKSAVSIDSGMEENLERLQKIAGDRPLYITHICGKGSILSHMVNQIEVFLRHLHLQGIDDPFVVVINPDKFVNNALVKMYDRKLWMIDERYPYLRKRLINLREWLVSQESPIAVDIDPHNPRPHVVNYWAPQMECWVKGLQTLEFTSKEEKDGQGLLNEFGLSNSDEFVCFGIRESSYYKSSSRGMSGDAYWMANYRDSDEEKQSDEELGALCGDIGNEASWQQRMEPLQTSLENYLPMAEKMAEKDVHVLRMGLVVDNPVPNDINPKVIDYASKFRSEFGDVYLSAKCKFVVAGGTGAQWISCAFGRPVVNTDVYLPNNAFLNTSQDGLPNLSIPRKFWYIEEKRFLTYSEVFKVFRRYQSNNNCVSDGVENLANTAEEITAVVMEMNARIDGTWQETSEDVELQERYRNLHTRKDDAYGSNGLIGSQFLRDNADLIQ
jgi:putative glycosyltransferase (TIGR04372 family)